MKLENAVIAVTGGASGLGAAAAELCRAKGAKVAVLDMNKARKPLAPLGPLVLLFCFVLLGEGFCEVDNVS